MTDPGEIFDQLKRAHRLEPEPSVKLRIRWLKSLRQSILRNREAIQEAVQRDFGKSALEADISEIIPTLIEIRTAIRQLRAWSAPRRVRNPFPFWGLKTSTQWKPKGVVLILAPWNYPINLSITPLVSAIAAGNRVLVKPSERSFHSARITATIVSEALPVDVAVVIEGGIELGKELLELPFNHFFFTGGARVGKLVRQAATIHTATATLELGGKSPAIVDRSADLEASAKKIVRGKYLNAGQTCIAPDYVIAHDDVFDRVVEILIEEAKRFRELAEMARPVDEEHRSRLTDLMKDAIGHGSVVHGPTDLSNLAILTGTPLSSKVMTEEIFGPLLPVVRYRSLDELLALLGQQYPPLTAYVFTKSDTTIDRLAQAPLGSLVINETLLHFGHPGLPFGGVMQSGFGRSTGKAGFESFSNILPTLKQKLRKGVIPLVYPGNDRLQDHVLKLLFRILER